MKIKYYSILGLFLLAPLILKQPLASQFSPAPVGSIFFGQSTTSGSFEQRVIKTESDRTILITKNIEKKVSNESQLFLGIVILSRESDNGVSPVESRKASELFPLKVGSKSKFTSFGTTNRQPWSRDIVLIVHAEHALLINGKESLAYSIGMTAKSSVGDFYSFEGICIFSVFLGRCVDMSGEIKIKDRPEFSGPFKSSINKAIIENQEYVIKIVD
jgi:hypothetical protein